MTESLGPICFGAVTLYSESSDQCLACASFYHCGERVAENLAEVSRVLDVESIVAKHKAIKIKKAEEQKKEVIDSGRLKTQAPAVQRNVEPATIALTDAHAMEIKTEQRSILIALTGGRPLAELRDSLQRKVNPFASAMTEQWLLCELMLRGVATRGSIEHAIKKVGGTVVRAKSAVLALQAAKLIPMEPQITHN